MEEFRERAVAAVQELGQLGSPASREDVEKFRCLIEDIRRDERAAVVGSKPAELGHAKNPDAFCLVCNEHPCKELKSNE